jgi:regulatory protein
LRQYRNTTDQKIDDKAKAMDRAMRLLAARAHYSGELRTKLYRKNFTKAAIDYVESECWRMRLLDDEQFAHDLCSELSSRGFGPYQIKFRMRKKGIPAEMIEQAMAEMAEEEPDAELEAAEYSFNTKMRLLVREEDPRKKREKLYRYMMTRGFTSDVIRALLEENEL